MPAENEPAEPNALTQSLQLTCSLTPSSTEPSTRLVTIWLKRCCARPLIDCPLDVEPVGVGVGVGVGDGEGDALCAYTAPVCAVISTSKVAATSSAEGSHDLADVVRTDFAM